MNKEISPNLGNALDKLLKKVLSRKERRLKTVKAFHTELETIVNTYVDLPQTKKLLTLTALQSSIRFHKEKLKKVEIELAPAIETAPEVSVEENVPTAEATPSPVPPTLQSSPEQSSLTQSRRPDLDAIIAAQRCKKELGARQVKDEVE